ncbi:hypothetical protein LB505_010555 [Fusarium chuoi]|nr:hypothetical protein LB505_010555 [Fusarium chuoi]
MDNFVSFTKTWHNKPYPSIDPTRPELSAAGKFVAITGGGTGIGRSIAIAFAQAGASTVAILGRRLDRLEIAAAEIAEASGATPAFLPTWEQLSVSMKQSFVGASNSTSLAPSTPSSPLDLI